MHGFAAGIALMTLALYADRSGWLYHYGTQTRWAIVTRLGMAGILLSLTVGFVDLAAAGAPFEWRHWVTLSALLLAAIGHMGLRHGGPQSPT